MNYVVKSSMSQVLISYLHDASKTDPVAYIITHFDTTGRDVSWSWMSSTFHYLPVPIANELKERIFGSKTSISRSELLQGIKACYLTALSYALSQNVKRNVLRRLRSEHTVDYTVYQMASTLASFEVVVQFWDSFLRLPNVSRLVSAYNPSQHPGSGHVAVFRRLFCNTISVLLSIGPMVACALTPSNDIAMFLERPMVQGANVLDNQSELLMRANMILREARDRGLPPDVQQFLDSFTITLGQGMFHTTYISPEHPDLVLKDLGTHEENEAVRAVVASLTETPYGAIGVPVDVYYHPKHNHYTLITKKLLPVKEKTQTLEDNFYRAIKYAAEEYGVYTNDIHDGNVFLDPADNRLKLIDSDFVDINASPEWVSILSYHIKNNIASRMGIEMPPQLARENVCDSRYCVMYH